MGKRTLCMHGLYVQGYEDRDTDLEIDSIEVDDAEEFAQHLEEEEISPANPAEWTENMLWKEFHDEMMEDLSKYGR